MKRHLTQDPLKDVLVASKETEIVGNSVLSLISKPVWSCRTHSKHPLEKAGLSVQEDLCLMHRTPRDGFSQLLFVFHLDGNYEKR